MRNQNRISLFIWEQLQVNESQKNCKWGEFKLVTVFGCYNG